MAGFDLIIPTMWVPTNLLSCLEKYIAYQHLDRVILIDNHRRGRPVDPILSHPKITIIDYGRNIYVNPAWNEGAARATSDQICIANDDIDIGESVFELVNRHGLSDGDLIGVNLRGYHDNYKIDDWIDTAEEIVEIPYDKSQPVGGQAWAFGICMFMKTKSYFPIPDLYQVWFGDDYLAQRSTRIFAINTNSIKGTISETLKKHDHTSEIHKRLILDCENLVRFDHFENGRSWDIPRNMIAKAKQHPKKKVDIFKTEYIIATTTKSDINENVHILYDLAKTCKHATEMGVRTGVSTRALLYSGVDRLVCYDITLDEKVGQLFRHARSIGRDVEYIQADVLAVKIEPTDLLFIDTYHTYDQLKQELALHGNQARKYIALHDTHTFGLAGEHPRDKKGLLSAVIEFLIENPHWRFKTYRTNNNGFTVLERTDAV